MPPKGARSRPSHDAAENLQFAICNLQFAISGPMKIAVFLPSWIGDVVMATPALQALRRHFREAYLLGVLKPYVAGVLQGSAWLDDHVFLDKRGPWANRWPAVAARLRRDKI